MELPNRSMDTVDKAFAGFLFMTLLLFVIITGILCLTGYINWSNAPQGMFLREIMQAVR